MNSKRKGNDGEKELLRILSEHGIDCKRNLQGMANGFKTGADNPDIQMTIDGIQYHVEVKRTERLRLSEAMEQARHDCGERVPMVVHRANRQPWSVTMSLDDFLMVMRC